MTPTEQDKASDEEIKQQLYKLISDISVETENYIESKGRLIRLPMEARIEPVMQLIIADRKRVALEARLDENEEWRLFSKEVQRGILPIDFKARMITLREPYQLSEAQQEEV